MKALRRAETPRTVASLLPTSHDLKSDHMLNEGLS